MFAGVVNEMRYAVVEESLSRRSGSAAQFYSKIGRVDGGTPVR